MACRLCRLDTPATLCEVCRFLTEQGPAHREFPACCHHCGAPIASPAGEEGLCQLCTVLIDNVRGNGWFVRSQGEWNRENIQLARRKRELLE